MSSRHPLPLILLIEVGIIFPSSLLASIILMIESTNYSLPRTALVSLSPLRFRPYAFAPTLSPYLHLAAGNLQLEIHIFAGAAISWSMGRIAVAVTVASWIIPISVMFNQIVTEPYMDEIFHIPQAQKYCRGNFKSWDPMITTPPGLYFLSLAYVSSMFPGLLCIQSVSAISDLCSTSILRFTNGVLAVICSILIYEIMTHLRPSPNEKKATLFAVVLSLYPLHWFFTFLYYTDVASLTTVLAMYLLVLKKKFLFSSVLGALSVLIRQTNIIWMLFVAFAGVIKFTESHSKPRMEAVDFSASTHKDNLSSNHKGASVSNLRKRRPIDGMTEKNKSNSRVFFPVTYSAGLLDEIQGIIIISWNHFGEFLVAFGPFSMVLVAFVAFVWWNGGIVLGAKDAHVVSPHFSQLLYYGMVSAVFMVPVHFSLGQISVLFRQLSRNKLLNFFPWFIGLSVSFLSVRFFSIAHPYLLADNRHYTFYIWRKVINYHESMKYIMIPFYVYSWFSILTTLVQTQKKLWVFAYFFACVASLIPAPLIEFRYYTIPFFFLVLHSNITDTSLVVMGILYLSINCFTAFMFLFRPFSWDHEAGTQRFIW